MKSRLFAGAACAVCAAAVAVHPRAQGPVAFTAHEIATGLRGGYQVVVADMNKDAKPDVIALAQAMPELVWYENPDWQRHVVAAGMSRMINVAANDLDGDGVPELALAQGFTTDPKTSPGTVSILKRSMDPNAPWTVREIDRIPTAHRLRWVDADGSGKKWLVAAPLVGPDAVAPDYKSPVSIAYYRPPDFKREVLTDTFSGLIHGVEPVRWPGVGGQALLSAGFMGIHLHRYAAGRWTTTPIAKGDPSEWPKSGTSDIALGRSGTRRIIATIEPWHGNQVVVYTEAGDMWARKVVDEGITDGHAIVALDIDGDGADEIVVGQRGGARSVMLYEMAKDGAWSRRAIDDGGMGGSGCAAADLNADKRVDVVCIGSATANLKWYENMGVK